MTQGIQLMKSTFLGLSIENVLVPITVMVAVTVVCAAIAVIFFKWE